MRSGFKMRQSASEGGGLVAHARANEGGGGVEFLEEGRSVLGSSSSLNSLGNSPRGRAGATIASHEMVHAYTQNIVCIHTKSTVYRRYYEYVLDGCGMSSTRSVSTLAGSLFDGLTEKKKRIYNVFGVVCFRM